MCASLNLKLKKTGGGDWGGGRSASPTKADWKHPFSHARCWVECDTQGVYTTRHAPRKHVECRLRHNDAQ